VNNILINGQYQNHISALDRGLHYGDGVFETLKVIKGHPLRLQQHLQRLQHGCERLRIPQPPLSVIMDEIKLMTRDDTNTVLKIMITRGQGGRGYRVPEPAQASRILIRYDMPSYPSDYYQRGVAVGLCASTLSCNPRLAGIKHLNRLEHILARDEWQGDSISEGLMTDPQGFIIEGTMSNVFLVNNMRLVTPDISSCGVAGIMRQQVLELAQDLGISIDITQVDRDELFNASEVFLTNSLIGIWPVRSVVPFSSPDQPLANYTIGSITRQLMLALTQNESRKQEV